MLRACGWMRLPISTRANLLPGIRTFPPQRSIAGFGHCAVPYTWPRYSNLSASTVNCGLRTLRRALHLAFEWGKLERMPKIGLAKGERQRERVLSREEAIDYLAMCSQPWRDVATLILGAGVRPGEAYKLRWEHVALNGHGGLIQITEGKTKAARRMLPMVPAVYQA